MTEIIRMASESNDGTFSEKDMIWLITPPDGWGARAAVLSIFRSGRCTITPKIMAALAKWPEAWRRDAIEAICLGTLKRKP